MARSRYLGLTGAPVLDPTDERDGETLASFEAHYAPRSYPTPINGHAAYPGLSWHSKTLPYPDYICVVPLLHATERAVSTGAVLNAENQFGVGKTCQSKRKVKAQVKKNIGTAMMVDLMQALLANRT